MGYTLHQFPRLKIHHESRSCPVGESHGCVFCMFTEVEVYDRQHALDIDLIYIYIHALSPISLKLFHCFVLTAPIPTLKHFFGRRYVVIFGC